VKRRRAWNTAMTAACVVCIGLAILPLASLSWMVVSRGAHALSWTFLTHLPRPVGETGGGVGNGIVGSAIILALAALVGLPIGVGAGLYLAANGETSGGRAVRFIAEVLSGAPSVVVGLAVYAVLVRPMHGFSALAGSVALAILMIPTLARSTEEVVRLVPRDLFEASLALGVSEWRSSLKVVARTALGGITTACCLALARAAGETAPLLFTALGNEVWNLRPTQPMASLPVQIFNYAKSPYADWQQQAWGAALVLLILVGVLNAVARLSTRKRFAGAA
jgi:phosphate transport system permease protein